MLKSNTTNWHINFRQNIPMQSQYEAQFCHIHNFQQLYLFQINEDIYYSQRS